MTVERLMRYPIYREGLLDSLFAQIAPKERDHLVISALLRAMSGPIPLEGEVGTSCPL